MTPIPSATDLPLRKVTAAASGTLLSMGAARQQHKLKQLRTVVWGMTLSPAAWTPPSSCVQIPLTPQRDTCTQFHFTYPGQQALYSSRNFHLILLGFIAMSKHPLFPDSCPSTNRWALSQEKLPPSVLGRCQPTSCHGISSSLDFPQTPSPGFL